MITFDGTKSVDDGTRCNVDNCRNTVGTEFEEVGDHKKKTLGRGVGGNKRTGFNGTVESTSNTTFCLHHLNSRNIAENILLVIGMSPSFNKFKGWSGGCNGITKSCICKGISNICSSSYGSNN